jgi:hypothetical protein
MVRFDIDQFALGISGMGKLATATAAGMFPDSNASSMPSRTVVDLLVHKGLLDLFGLI